MSTVVSITVVVHDGDKNITFEVDTANHCALVWNQEGWDLLADHYKHVKVHAEKEKQVRKKDCGKATPKPGTAPLDSTPTAKAAFALKTPGCIPTQFP